MNWILIRSENNLICNYSNATEEPICYTNGFEWIDWRENIGTEEEPIYTGRAAPSDTGEYYYTDGQIMDSDGNAWEEEIGE